MTRRPGLLRISSAILPLLVLACGRTSQNAYRVGTETLPSEGVAGAPADAFEPVANCATSIVASDERFCAVYQDGSVWCWAHTSNDSWAPAAAAPNVVRDLQGVVQVGLGTDHACAIDVDEVLWCWGDNGGHQIATTGEATFPPTRIDVPAPLRLGLGLAHTCVTNANNAVYCWGDNGGLTTQTPYEPVAELFESGTSWYPVAGSPAYLDGYGRLYHLASLAVQLPDPGYDSGNMWVGQGNPQTCALKRNGSLWCSDADGAHGGRLVANIELGESVMEAGVGDRLVCALTRQGQVWCEGQNDLGQSGRALGQDFVAGGFVPNLAGVRRLAVARKAVCALDDGGSVWCWGAYDAGHTSSTPELVTGCEGQVSQPQVASAEWDGYGDTLGWRLEQASKARAQALCRCAFGSIEDACEREETFAPNGLCLEAVMFVSDRPVADCQAESYWEEAACWASAACGSGSIPSCAQPPACDEMVEPKAWGFCRQRGCDNQLSSLVRREQLCDHVADCEDGSDERNCRQYPWFECQDGVLADAETFGLCDGKNDCEDGSDERCLF